jgi:hypothetical protein
MVNPRRYGFPSRKTLCSLWRSPRSVKICNQETG